MKKIFTWGLFGISSLSALIIAALLLAPLFVDVQQYKPRIESRLSEITGRPFTVGGDIRLTFFPRAGLSLSGIHIGNLPGFETTDFLSAKSFEVHVELLPLLSKEIRIKRFSLKSPIITLTRNSKGIGNWEGFARREKEDRTEGKKQQTPLDEMPDEEFFIGSPAIYKLTLSEGVLLWIDRTKGKRREFSNLAMVCKASKNSNSLSLSDGSLSFDETTLNFSAVLKDFPKPEITFDLIMDRFDMDRYLPPKEEKQQRQERAERSKKDTPVSGGKPDCTVLRSLALNGDVLVKELKIKGAKIQDFYLKLMGKNGLFQIQPFAMKLYGGKMSGAGLLNLVQNVLHAQIQLKARGIQAGPMVKDILKKEIIEGDFAMDLKIKATGNNNAAIKKSLHGEGIFQLTDGAINGIDLPGLLQNSRAAHELSEASDGVPRTRFSQFTIPFTISDGVMTTTETTLASTLLNIQVEGQADIVDETLDFRIEPRFMAPAKGRKDEGNQKGVTIPVLVGGTFSSPRFLPDLDFILKQNFGKELKGLSELQKVLLQSREDDGKESRGDKIMDFLNKLR